MVLLGRYLLGLIGACKDVERYAISRARELDSETVRVCLQVVQSAHHALQQFNLRNGDLRRAYDSMKYTQAPQPTTCGHQ